MTLLRRLRIKYQPWHIPKNWGVYFEGPGAASCYCHASTLDEACYEAAVYFKGGGVCKPLSVDPHKLPLRKQEKAYDTVLGRSVDAYEGLDMRVLR